MMFQQKTTAVILAGGLGTRLRPVEADKPKVMALVNDRPFLEYLLDQLADNGLQRIIVCTGYKGDQIQRYFGGSYRNIELLYSHENTPLGTGGALRLAAEQLGSETALVLNGDSFCRYDYKDFVLFHRSKEAMISAAVVQVSDVSRYGSVELDNTDLITGFSEKGENSGTGLINAGVYLVEPDVINSIPMHIDFSLEKELFPRHIGSSLYGYKSCKDFIDIGVPADYGAAQHFFR